MAAIEEIETLLQSLLALKPPGVTKTKIQTLTEKCTENVQSEATVVQKIVQQFKKSPATHKLGVLYVVDSVARAWLDRARKTGQAVIKTAAPGTFASGVQQITNVLPNLMEELVQCAPENQKEKISKLLDIWERGQTFPLDMIAGFKQQLGKPKTNTPPGSPPKVLNTQNQQGSFSQTNPFTVAPAPAPVPAPQDAGALLAALAGFAQPTVQANPVPAAPAGVSFPQSVIPPPPPPGFIPNPSAAPPNVQPAVIPGIGNINELVAQILQGMQAGSIAPAQGLQVLNALNTAQNGGLPFAPPPPAAVTQPTPLVQNAAPQERYDQSSDRYRDRSRSPDYNGRRRSPLRRSPPNRRDSPTYGVYDPNAGNQGSNANRLDRGERGRGRGKTRGGRSEQRSEYRQRSPPAQRRQSPDGNGFQNGNTKFIDWDPTLPRDHIRVLSRTLFVGGAGGTESEIRSIFSQFGRVQTCIVAQEKRHAFVKMMTRPDAVAAKEGMDAMNDPVTLSKARQTRWGVGFGPRDCSNYENGISVIPIARLTDADRKWVVTAEHGGTGGRPLEGGMVIEEPDIEIGAGVSSKAISRRVPAEAGRGRGGYPRGGRGGGHDNESRFRKVDRPQNQVHEPRHIEPRPEPQVAVPPAIPGFGFQLPGMPGSGY